MIQLFQIPWQLLTVRMSSLHSFTHKRTRVIALVIVIKKSTVRKNNVNTLRHFKKHKCVIYQP